MLSPPGYNHPARVAERIAMLDLVSSGRVEWGTGASASRAELEGFNVDPGAEEADVGRGHRAERQHDGDDALPRLQGRVLLDAGAQRHSQAAAEAAPADLARLLATARRSTRRRATASARWPSPSSIPPRRRNGPANTTRSSSPRSACRSATRSTPTSRWRPASRCTTTRRRRSARGGEGFQFFGFALGHYYVYGEHKPGVTNVWERFERGARRDAAGESGNGIGTPAQLIERLKQYQDAGVDQVIFVQQAGRNKHADIIASLELFAAEVMPAMKADQAARDARKQAELAPYIEAALKRKKWMRPLAPERCRASPPMAARSSPATPRRRHRRPARRRHQHPERGSGGEGARGGRLSRHEVSLFGSERSPVKGWRRRERIPTPPTRPRLAGRLSEDHPCTSMDGPCRGLCSPWSSGSRCA